MRLLAGTQVLRLYPGCVQVGTDPGREVILSGLSEDHERWLAHCAHVSDIALRGGSECAQMPVPDECEAIVQRLVAAGLAYRQSTDGLAVLVSRVEEPVFLALEGAYGAGSITQCRIVDPRPARHMRFTSARMEAVSLPVDRWAHEYFQRLFPEAPRPTASTFDLEIRSIPLSQTFCEDPDLLSFPCPRLIVRIGQVSASIGPLLTEDAPLCPLCIATWNAEERLGVWPQSWEEHSYAPQITFHTKHAAAQVIARFIDAYAVARRHGMVKALHQVWHTRMVSIDHRGALTTCQIGPHPQCQCQQRQRSVFAQGSVFSEVS